MGERTDIRRLSLQDYTSEDLINELKKRFPQMSFIASYRHKWDAEPFFMTARNGTVPEIIGLLQHELMDAQAWMTSRMVAKRHRDEGDEWKVTSDG